MHFVVDRIEGDTAVLEIGGGTFNVPVEMLPVGVEEGWVLRAEFARDEAEEASRRDGAGGRMAALAGDDDGGDFSL